MLPHDTSDQRLIQRVHPPQWPEPVVTNPVELLVIGGGPAGLICAAAAARLGAQVVMVEREHLGGDSLVSGSVPSKSLMASSRKARLLKDARARRESFVETMTLMRRKRAALAERSSAEHLAEQGVQVLFGNARFEDPETVLVDGSKGCTRLTFRKAIVATGSRPAPPAVPGLEKTPYLTHTNFFDLQQLPDRLLVLGGGTSGLEMAQAFARFGAEVTILERSDRLLPKEEPETSEAVRIALVEEGIHCLLGVRVLEAFVRDGHPVLRFEKFGNESTVEGDVLLVMTGRQPNIDGLTLENAGIQSTGQGILVNDHLQTTSRRIWACGDATGMSQHTHTADAHGRIAVENALFRGWRRHSRLVSPTVTFTDPEIAHIGATREQLEAKGTRFHRLHVDLADVDRSILEEESGWLEVLADPKGRILGASLIHSIAGELIVPIAIAMSGGISLGKLAKMVFPYPTRAEALKRVADQFNRTRINPGSRKLLDLLRRFS